MRSPPHKLGHMTVRNRRFHHGKLRLPSVTTMQMKKERSFGGDYPRAPFIRQTAHVARRGTAVHRTRCTFTKASTVSCSRMETADVLTTPLL